MQVNFSEPIRNLDGTSAKSEDGKDITLGTVTVTSLLGRYQDEQNLAGEEQVKRFRLAEKAYEGGDQEISVDDAALIKRMIAKAFPPLVTARAFDIIDPKKVVAAAEEPSPRRRPQAMKAGAI